MVGDNDWYQRVFEHSVDGVLIVRPNGEIVAANPAACRLLGRSEEQIKQGGRAALIDDERYVQQMLDRWLADGFVAGEREHARPDGTRVVIEFSSGLLPARAGEEPIGYVFLRDVTMARRAAAELMRAAERQRLLAAASAAFAAAGADDRAVLEELAQRVVDTVADTCQVRLLSTDGSALALAAVHAHEPEIVDGLRALDHAQPARADDDGVMARVIASSQALLVPVVDPEQVLASIPPACQALFRRHPQHSLMVVPLRARGRCLGVLAVSRHRRELPPFSTDDLALVQDLSDRAALMVHNARLIERSAHDLDERKRLEGERERLAAVLEQATEMVLITDRTGAIQYVNPAFVTVTGYSRAEVLGHNPRLLKSGAQTPDLYRALWSTLAAGKTWCGRLVNKKKDGSLYTEDAIIAPVRNDAGLTTGYFALKRDVTRDLALEAQLQEAQKMEGIGRLAGGVAHDFNNLLSVILSCARFALDALKQGDPVREDVLQIEAAGQRAAQLTHQLLAFSRRQPLRPRPLDVNKILVDMQALLKRVLGEDVEVVHALAPTLGVVVADPGQLEQVLINLAVNARDAMPSGGTLTIATAEVALDAERAAALGAPSAGRYARISVADTGVGMSAETRARIFEPFFTTKGPGQGTGLGLSTVFGIVTQSGGAIDVDTAVGRGTTMSVLLPITDAAPAATAAARGDDKPNGRPLVLVVEDEDAVRRVTCRMLEAAGYRVLSAANGADALSLCEQHKDAIDVLLSDVVMPHMSGPELLRRARSHCRRTRMILMSGYTADAIERQGAMDPDIVLLDKPLMRDVLLRAVRDASAGAAGLSR